MRSLRTIGWTFIAACLVTATSRADVILTVDLDPATPGIQSTGSYSPGQSLNANVLLNLTGNSTLSAYQYSISFDRAELTFQSRSELLPQGFGFVETDASNINNLSQGLLFRFGADSGAGPVAPAGPFVIGALSFLVNAPMGDETDIDILPARIVAQGDDFLENGTFSVIPNAQLVFNGASVSVQVVPEPTSLALLSVGLASALCQRRRRR